MAADAKGLAAEYLKTKSSRNSKQVSFIRSLKAIAEKVREEDKDGVAVVFDALATISANCACKRADLTD
jgi:hypothetical protein